MNFAVPYTFNHFPTRKLLSLFMTDNIIEGCFLSHHALRLAMPVIGHSAAWILVASTPVKEGLGQKFHPNCQGRESGEGYVFMSEQ